MKERRFTNASHSEAATEAAATAVVPAPDTSVRDRGSVPRFPVAGQKYSRLVFAEEPILRRDRLRYPLGDGEALGELAEGGIMIVWPICNFRSFSM